MSKLKLECLTQKHLARTEWEAEAARHPLQSLSPTIKREECVGQIVHLGCKVSDGLLPTQRLDQNVARNGPVWILARALSSCEKAGLRNTYEK